jgi:alkanesulfonate monooxygenase
MPAKRQRTTNDTHGVTDHKETNGIHFTAAPDVNEDPNRVKFAYWVPNVSGGLVISKIPQKTKCASITSIMGFELTASGGITNPM